MKNRNHLSKVILLLMMALNFFAAVAQNLPDQYNVVWNSQSKNSGESMPCGGGDIGLNVWVENNELFFYIAKSGTFDENNTLVKPGRIRIKLSPNPFEGKSFRQELILKDGYVNIMASSGKLTTDISIWVDVFHPAIHVTIKDNTPVITEASYESWRYKDRISKGAANNTNSYKWAAPKEGVENYKDEIGFENNGVLFYHRNNPYTVFDFTVHQQGLDSVKEQLFNPLKNLTSGGRMEGSNMKAAGETEGVYLNTDFKGWKLKSTKATRTQDLTIYLHTSQASNLEDWKNELSTIIQKTNADKYTLRNTRNWWKQFWDRSFVLINTTGSDTSTAWQVGRNYQLFRYMLGCNAFGTYPTKFNGGLFTYDPELVNKDFSFTPDFRNWGGGIHTAQNQRLVYFPMIKDGDFDLLRPQFDFYLRILKNAELRSRVYWNHDGACFTEQMDNYGLPDCAEYGTNRPAGFDKGLEYNAWLEYLWDTVLEFCYMMLEEERYTQKDVSSYIPFIESCL
ncbi:MAG: DUF5703 domain-containing protein, partial [Flavisolibacter sp.]